MRDEQEESKEKILLEGHFVRKDQSKSYTEVLSRLGILPVIPLEPVELQEDPEEEDEE
jgi:hypothetical protein